MQDSIRELCGGRQTSMSSCACLGTDSWRQAGWCTTCWKQIRPPSLQQFSKFVPDTPNVYHFKICILYICVYMGPRRSSYSVNEVKQGIRSYFTLNSFRKAAVAVGVPKSTLCDWVNNIGRRLRSTRRHRYVVRERTILINQVRTLLMQNPFHTLYTLKHELGDVSIATLHRAVKKAGISYQQVSWRTPPRDMTQEFLQSFERSLIVA